jgi:hypothetical protein
MDSNYRVSLHIGLTLLSILSWKLGYLASARLLKFLATFWAFEGIVFFADHFQRAAEADTDFA